MATTLSIIAIVLSVASLAWQVITWRNSGHRIVVSRRLITVLGDGPERERTQLRVTVANKGRGPVEVDSCHIGFARQGSKRPGFEVPMLPEGKRRLEGTSSIEYELPASVVWTPWTDDQYRDGWTCAVAYLSTGEKVFSRKFGPPPAA